MLDFWKLYRAAKRDEITTISPDGTMAEAYRKLNNHYAAHGLDMHKLLIITNHIHTLKFTQARKWLHKIHNAEGRAKLSQYLDTYEQTVKQGNGADKLPNVKSNNIPPRITVSQNTQPNHMVIVGNQDLQKQVEKQQQTIRELAADNSKLQIEMDKLHANGNEALYKDCCNTVNQLRSQLSQVKQRLRNAEHQAKTRGDYGKRQFERAEKLQRQLKDTDNISDDAISDYQELKWKYQTLQNEFTSYKQGQKMDYSDAMRMILTGAVVDTNQDSVRGADQLSAQDWDDIEKLYLNLGFAKSYIDIWLWDIKNTPAGRIGERYKGKSYDPNMGYYVHRIDGLVHSAYQMIGAVQDYIKRGKAGRT